MDMLYTYLASPVGQLLLAGSDTGSEFELEIISFPGGETARRHENDWVESDLPFAEVKRQLNAYFAGELTDFELPINAQGTEFQQQVWQALRQIPYGETCSYSDIANAISKPSASRAVGAANHLNPIPLVIPCHRVIGKDGQLVGFGGGLPVKKALLLLENAACMQIPEQQQLF